MGFIPGQVFLYFLGHCGNFPKLIFQKQNWNFLEETGR